MDALSDRGMLELIGFGQRAISDYSSSMSNTDENQAVPKLPTGEIIQRSLAQILEGITGIAGSQRSDWFLTLGHLLQRVRSGRFLSTFLDEWNKYVEKGRVEDGYMYTIQHQECLQEMLDFLDKDSPDEVRFTILKKILLTAAIEKISDRDSLLPQQYVRLCRSLSSGEAVLLLAVYQIAADGTSPEGHVSAADWLKQVAEVSGLRHIELVELHEQGLIEKRLLSPRLHSDRSGVDVGQHFRMTGLAVEVCRYVEAYDSMNPLADVASD